MTIDPEKMRTLRNWVGDKVITFHQMKQLIDEGRVSPARARETLVSYADLQSWGVA
jgi:hypothetical protein